MNDWPGWLTFSEVLLPFEKTPLLSGTQKSLDTLQNS